MKTRPFSTLAAVLLLFVVARTDALPLSVAKQRLMVAGERFVSAYNAHSASRIGALYARDAVLHVPGVGVLRGRRTIVASYRELFSIAVRVRVQTKSITRGRMGRFVARGTYASVLRAENGATVMERGNFVTVFKFVGGVPLIVDDRNTPVGPLTAVAQDDGNSLAAMRRKDVMIAYKRYGIVFGRGDFGQLARFYAKDAVFRVGSRVVASGRGNVIKFLRDSLPGPLVDSKPTDVKITRDDMGRFIVAGGVVNVYRSKEGKRVTDRATFKMVWKFTGGFGTSPVIVVHEGMGELD